MPEPPPGEPDHGTSRSWCPIEATMQIVGSRTVMLLLREAGRGITRFDDFVARTGFSAATVSARLSELTEVGILARSPYREPGARERHEYVLTEKGTDLLPAIVGLFQWGVRHAAPDSPNGAPSIAHRECGSPVHAELRCANDHRPELKDLILQSGSLPSPSISRPCGLPQ